MRGSIKSAGGVPLMVVGWAAVLLSGCGWFDGSSNKPEKLRPGAEKAIQPSESLPAPSGGRNYDPAIMPVQAAVPPFGSVVAATGGQKAQIEKLEKEGAARDAEERAQRERIAVERERNAPAAGPGKGPAGPGKVAGTADPGEPPILPTTPAAPPRAPITGTPVPAPSDGPPLDPNNTTPKPAGT